MAAAWFVCLGLLIGIPWLEERWARRRRSARSAHSSPEPGPEAQVDT